MGAFVQPGLNVSVTTHAERVTGRGGVLTTYHIFLPQTEVSTHSSIALGTSFQEADIGPLRAGVYNATVEDKVVVEAIQRVKSAFEPKTQHDLGRPP